MSTLNEMFDEFNSTYDYKPVELTPESLTKTLKLIQDEVGEIGEEIKEPLVKPNVAKELADNLYITMQQMRAYGMDIDGLLKELHRSNLSKTVPASLADFYVQEAKARYPKAYAMLKGDRAILRCAETNKVIKPSIYSPAVIGKHLYGEA